jgi:hypothetical protein
MNAPVRPNPTTAERVTLTARARVSPEFMASLAWLAGAIERGERMEREQRSDRLDRLDRLDPLAELALRPHPTDDLLRALAREGVDLAALVRHWEASPNDIPKLDRVEFYDRGRRFDFVPEGGTGALVFLARDPNREPIDLAAWAPPRPPATWLGQGALLGERLFGFRRHTHLRVHEDVMQWLRAACIGVVIVDPRNAAPLLRRAEPLVTASVEFGVKLRRMLAVPPPQILIAPRSGRVAA